jgi:DNA adenine methylase
MTMGLLYAPNASHQGGSRLNRIAQSMGRHCSEAVDGHISSAHAWGDMNVRVEATRRFGTLSPLRYPGGKSALAGLFADLITELGVRNCTYVEPYAGGAGAGIALLRAGIIKRLVINDIDPAVYSFWAQVVNHNARFVDWIAKVPLTLNEWRRQRDIYRSGSSDCVALARAFFYLNRTNRSGVLNAGVIGGQAQTGRYKIDARFNRETLVGRIQAIGELRSFIDVTALDGRTVIQQHARKKSVFLYIDPPYVHAGSQLYLNAFEARDHEALADTVGRVGKAHWLMTYDESSFIERLYAGHFQAHLGLTYSARYPGKTSELLVASAAVGELLVQRTTRQVSAGG